MPPADRSGAFYSGLDPFLRQAQDRLSYAPQDDAFGVTSRKRRRWP